MSEAVKKLFTEISPTYDRLNHLLSLNVDKSWRKKTIARIQKSQGHFKALDLCCGTFDLSLECVKQFPRAKIYAIDFSETMLQAGKEKIRRFPQITPICGDALSLPFEKESFDVVFCGFGVRNLDDIEKGLKEIYRVLKPQGQILILEFFKPASSFQKLFHKTYLTHILPRIGSWVSGNPKAYLYLKNSIQGFLTVPEFCENLQKIGFENIEIQDYLFKISSCVEGEK